jgi:hypothetical protein
MKNSLSILLVDDHPQAKLLVENFLNNHGINNKINFMLSPNSNFTEWVNSSDFPKRFDLDKYDFAFVDIELDPEHKAQQDYAGAQVVLPYLRVNAPWLPIVGYSRLYESDEPKRYNAIINAYAGTYSFDIGIPRSIFTNEQVNRTNIEFLLNSALTNRISACISVSPDLSNKPTINMDSIKNTLFKIDEDIENLLQNFFWFSKNVFIEKFTPGFSGSLVLKAFTDIDLEHSSEESMWIIKINSSPFKLHRELRSHQIMTRKGLSHAMMVPLLWPNVVCDGNCTIMGYQFAKDYLPISHSLVSKDELFKSLNSISSSFKAFYSRNSIERRELRKILQDNIGPIILSDIDNFDIVPANLKLLLEDYYNGSRNKTLDQTFVFSSCLIHGDLHCDNMMTNKNNILFIDFAHSQQGPIIYDISKLFLDIIVRLTETKTENFCGFDQGKVIKEVSSLLLDMFDFNHLLKQNDNFFLLNLLIVFQTINYLGFKKDDLVIKKWLRSYLQIFQDI